MRATKPLIIVPALLLIPNSGQSQPAPTTRPTPILEPQTVGRENEVIIYRDRNFDGPAVSIRQDEPNLRLVWTVSSARVRNGAWQLCERPNYQGSCQTLTTSNSNMGARRVQSVRTIRMGVWRNLGTADVARLGWTHTTTRIPGNPSITAVRLCAERNRVRIHHARARFANNRFQTLHVPNQLASGRCTDPVWLANPPRNLARVELTASTTSVGVRARIRIEGR